MKMKILAYAISLLTLSPVYADQTYSFMEPDSPKLVQTKKGHVEIEPQLGTGYSSDQQQYVQNCLNIGVVSYQGTGQSVINLSDQISYDALQQSLNVRVDAKAGIGPFSAKASANYARSVKEDDYSRSLIYAESIQLTKPTYNMPQDASKANDSLNSLGRTYANDPQAFRRYCGDQFVYQYAPSASLYVTVKLKFYSHEDKQNFNASAGVSVPIGKITTTVDKMVREKKIKGSIVFYAFQVGGIPENLGKLLQGDTQTGTAPILECSFDKLDRCTQTLNQIIKYASDSSYGLPSQIQADKSGIPSSNASKSNFTLVPYQAAGVTVKTVSEVTPAIEQAREKIGESYIKTLEDIDHINELMNSGFIMPADSSDQLKLMLTDAENNKALLESTANYCYSYDITRCAPQTFLTLSSLKAIPFGFKKWLLTIHSGHGRSATYAQVREIPNGAWGNVITKYISGNKYLLFQDGKMSNRMATINTTDFNLDYQAAKNNGKHEVIRMTSKNNGATYSGQFIDMGEFAQDANMTI